MNQSDPLDLVSPGTLVRPGTIGRLARLLMGILCLYALIGAAQNYQSIIGSPIAVFPQFAIVSGIALFIINYVVNIGFSKSWGRWPSYVSLGGFAILASVGFAVTGNIDSPILGIPFLIWLVYFYGPTSTRCR